MVNGADLNSEIAKNDLYEFIEYQLPIFDEILAEQQKPLAERPLAAAFHFVNYCVVEIKGNNKENFIEKEWFRTLYQLIKKWYQDRYAEAMKHQHDQKSLGMVLVYDTPFQFNIPLSVAEEKEADDKMWFCLPNSVLENENVLDWFTNKPNFTRMSEGDLESLRKKVSDISSFTRAIRVNLMSATLEKEELHKISGSIPAHIDKAVRDILSLNDGRISTSFWEIHLAVEKALKLIILQNGHEHGNKHDLNKLCIIANNISGIKLDCNLFGKFPSDHEAIKQRYGEGNSFTIQQAVNNYIYALGVLANLTDLLKRKFVLKNARFLIQIPPWEK